MLLQHCLKMAPSRKEKRHRHPGNAQHYPGPHLASMMFKRGDSFESLKDVWRSRIMLRNSGMTVRYTAHPVHKKNARIIRAFFISIRKDQSVFFANLFHRQADTALLVHFKNFDLDYFTFFNHISHILNTLIRELRNMYQTVTTRCQ